MPRTPARVTQADVARPYTPETLAAEWQCSAKHIRTLVNKGELRGFRLGGRLIRIPAEAKEEYECRRIALEGSRAGSSSTSSTTQEKEQAVIDLEPRLRAKLRQKPPESSTKKDKLAQKAQRPRTAKGPKKPATPARSAAAQPQTPKPKSAPTQGEPLQHPWPTAPADGTFSR